MWRAFAPPKIGRAESCCKAALGGPARGQPSARPHLLAAEGWLELGNPHEANAELEKIEPRLRVHPEVLEIRWRIYAAAERWDACLDLAVAVIKFDPRRRSGWFHHATALHRLGRAEEAREVLLSALDSLGDDSAFFYELARLCCVLHRVEEARAWLGKAFDLLPDAGARGKLKLMVLEETDLEPLWRAGSGWLVTGE